MIEQKNRKTEDANCKEQPFMPHRAFWNGRRVFLTGHTGFKGSWLSLWLEALGADVPGFALDPPTQPCSSSQKWQAAFAPSAEIFAIFSGSRPKELGHALNALKLGKAILRGDDRQGCKARPALRSVVCVE